MGKRSGFLITCLAFGYAFLYIPIISLVIFSFNKSKLVTVWGGFSTKWYGELFRSELMIDAALLSLRIAVVTACFAVALGTLAGFVIVRMRHFRGRILFAGMTTAPLVMPEVITGLSLLLLFVALDGMIGWPGGRGVMTITIAHITFCMAYVAVVVQSRLGDLDTSLEEAAMDLGARPLKVFFVITLPIIAPALVSGWLLAFTLSIDDLVIASFVSGPGSSTLPMIIFSKVKLGVSPDVNALATIIIGVVATGIILAAVIMKRQETKRQKDVQMAIAANE